jgi:hypothetical protein
MAIRHATTIVLGAAIVGVPDIGAETTRALANGGH